MGELSELHHCAVHAFVLMTNHVHIVVTPRCEDDISIFMKKVAQRFTRFVNKTHARTGTLWEGRFKSSLIDSERYLLRCYRYVEMNPVRAKLVDHPARYPWSSYLHNAMGAESPIITPHATYLALGRTPAARRERYRALFDVGISDIELTRIRDATKSGNPVGSEEFVARVQGMFRPQDAAAD
jgi:REP-associated tyrosine transposase